MSNAPLAPRDLHHHDSSEGSIESSLSDLWRIVTKRFWLAVLVFAAVSAVGVWWLGKRPVSWQAAAELVIETETPRILGEVTPISDPAGTSYWSVREYLNTQHRILASRAVAEEVASRLDLAHDLEFLGLADVTDAAILQESLRHVDVVDRVQSAVQVEPIVESQVVRIVVTTGSAESAAAIANTVAQVYIDRNEARQSESVASAATWLQEQYTALGTRLRDAEQALVSFRQTNNILAVDLAENASLLAEMQAVSSQLAQARLDADRLRNTVQQIRELLGSDSIVGASIDSVIDNQLIQQLKQQYVTLDVQRIALSARYLDQHPEIVALREQQAAVSAALEREIRAVLDSYEDELDTASALESRLAGRLATVEAEVQRLGEMAVTYRSLERAVDGNRELFSMVERRLQEVDLIRNSQHSTVQVLESAEVPDRAWDPNRFSSLVLVLALASLLAIAFPWGVEMLDNTVRTRETIERRYGLTFLGLIPSIKPSYAAKASQRGPARGQKWEADMYVHDFPKSNIAESCRSIRTNLMFMMSERPLDRLLITSAGPREGKTTTTCNIGTVMAQSGQRVLLVDTDMRRPRLHTAFKMKPKLGLSSLLLGEATADQAILETPIRNLFILPSGAIPPNPTELMMTERFKHVLDDLSARFDLVIFDSPPIAPVTDAIILSAHADGVLMVVKAGVTRKEMLARSVEQLRSVKARLLGAVLNDVDLRRRGQGYYYGYYYHQGAGYYGTTEEEEERAST